MFMKYKIVLTGEDLRKIYYTINEHFLGGVGLFDVFSFEKELERIKVNTGKKYVIVLDIFECASLVSLITKSNYFSMDERNLINSSFNCCVKSKFNKII